MINQLQESLWRQFGASIDMLRNVIANCPDNYFSTNKRFYYLAFHSIFLLDYYLSIPPADFIPNLPFTVKERADWPTDSIGDMIPDNIFSKEELVDYVNQIRLKCKQLIEGLTDQEILHTRFKEGEQEGDMDYSILEILFYNLRHTQHHIGQLNFIIRQDLGTHVDWAFRVDELKYN